MNERNRSAIGYDRLAKVYRPLEFFLFGSALQRSRVALIGRLPKEGRVLVLGDGDGRLLEQLCRVQTECDFTSVDQSEAMLDRQRRRVERRNASDRVQFIRQDARSYRPTPGVYDVLVTAFFLDCFSESELSELLPRWVRGLKESGQFYFVDFVRPESGLRRAQSAVYQAMMHWLFRWQTGLQNRTLVDLDSVLSSQEMTLLDSAAAVHPMTACRIYTRGSCAAPGNGE